MHFFIFDLSFNHIGYLSQITQDEAVIVRQAYAENIATIAETALRLVLVMRTNIFDILISAFLSLLLVWI